MSFSNLMLSKKLQETIKALGYSEPTEIQEKSIPLLLQNRDILATSQTGTGKTAAFVLPMLENLKEESEARKGDDRYKIKALILVPTRELALQVHAKVEAYGANFTHKSVALYGGIKLGSQVKQIRSGANIAIATTGRLLEHIRNGSINLCEVEIMVLDEADKMLEMGFIDDIRAILSKLPKNRQDKKIHSIMFSATFPPVIKKLANSFLHHPATIEIDSKNIATKQVNQLIHHVNEEEKLPLLTKLISTNSWEQILIFSNTKLQANKIAERLNSENIKSVAIHGDKSQGMRIEALKEFKEKNIRVLVATDVASRGIDIIDLPMVINFELPINNEDYIHRIGRTGRAKQNGEALSLICEKEREQLGEIELLVQKTLPTMTTEGFEMTSHLKTSKKKSKKEGVDLKKAKALAEKMMGHDTMGQRVKKKKGKPGGQKPSNKRLF